MWYRFESDGNETLYGWTRDPAIAQEALKAHHHVFPDRHYRMMALSDRDDETDNRPSGAPLGPEDAVMCGDDTTMEEIAAWVVERAFGGELPEGLSYNFRQKLADPS
jgi:hypothetical protein